MTRRLSITPQYCGQRCCSTTCIAFTKPELNSFIYHLSLLSNTSKPPNRFLYVMDDFSNMSAKLQIIFGKGIPYLQNHEVRHAKFTDRFTKRHDRFTISVVKKGCPTKQTFHQDNPQPIDFKALR